MTEKSFPKNGFLFECDQCDKYFPRRAMFRSTRKLSMKKSRNSNATDVVNILVKSLISINMLE